MEPNDRGIQSKHLTLPEAFNNMPYYALPRRGSVREQPNRHRQLDLSSSSESLGCDGGQREPKRIQNH